MNELLALYGLKFNPFSSELPTEALLALPKVDDFCWRVEHVLVREGGFALISGDPGTGKSVALRLLVSRLMRLPDVMIGVISHPQSSLVDFYREMGEVFGIALKPNNRWGGFKGLRDRWRAHLQSNRMRCCLIIDEAQELFPAVLSELRLLGADCFDSRQLIAIVLAGDSRLTEKLRSEELQPLGSRIRTRLTMDYAPREELALCLDHLLTTAGDVALMTPELKHTLCEHAMGNYRVLINMAAEVLSAGAKQKASRLDEKLYLELFAKPQANTPRRAARPR
jgi:general secretion pathway protein A